MNTPQEKLMLLFPVPSPAPRNFGLTPTRLPGPSYDSAQAVLDFLKDNHCKRHIFFNDLHFHNHASHHLLAIYAMGADRELLDAAYQTHVVYQRPAFESPGLIDEKNWKDHLGDDRYYQAYVFFFSDLLLSKEASTVLEDYIFSKDANIVPGKDKEAPNMLARYLGGFLHPLIHTGYGAEFGILGMWAEGLAEACVQAPAALDLFPPSLFDTVHPSTSMTSQLIFHIASLTLSSKSKNETSPHALSILGRVAKDPAFKPSVIRLPVPDGEDDDPVDRVARVCKDSLLKFLNEWEVEASHGDLLKKVEEVMWMNSLIYAVGGWDGREQGEDENKKFNGDFFLMHLVTSSLFMPSLISYLTPLTASLFVRAYFVSSLTLYIARGRPALPIAEFYAATTPVPLPSGPQPTPSEKTFTESNQADYDPQLGRVAWRAASKITTPNPWLPIIQTTLVHPNEHLCKAQRALAHFALVLGETPPGHFADLAGPSGLDGADKLDGSLFVRAAGLTADRLGWMREGQEERGWDTVGFFSE